MDPRNTPERSPLRGEPPPKTHLDRSTPLHVEIVSIGRELLRGRIADDNAPKLAEKLSRRGALVHRITVVDDSSRAIASALNEALARGAHLIVTSGGLGPGSDDRTLDAIASALTRPLTMHAEARRMVETAAHMVDRVLPRVQFRQWVLSVPRRIRWHMRHKPRVTSDCF